MIALGRDGSAVTPSDGNDNVFDFLFVGSGGDVTLEMHSGNSATFKNIDDGEYLLMACKKVKATGTTATNIVGCSLRG